MRVPESKAVVMRLQRNEKPTDWPKSFLDSIHASFPSNILQRYPDPSLFYKRLSDFLGVGEDNIVVASGIDELIKTLITLCCAPGDTISVVTPGYAMYTIYPRLLGIDVAPIVYDPEQFTNPVKLMAKVPGDCKILFLPTPSQPVENCFELDQLREIAAACRARDTLFAIDEAYCYFGAPEAVPLIHEFENVLILRTFSKAFGAASLRLGYVLGAAETIAPINAFRLAHEANAYALHVGLALLDNFDGPVKRSIADIVAGRDFLREACRAYGLKAWGSRANYVLVDLDSPERMKAVVAALSREGIEVKSHFSTPLDRHILVTCGPEVLMRAFFDRLTTILQK